MTTHNWRSLDAANPGSPFSPVTSQMSESTSSIPGVDLEEDKEEGEFEEESLPSPQLPESEELRTPSLVSSKVDTRSITAPSSTGGDRFRCRLCQSSAKDPVAAMCGHVFCQTQVFRFSMCACELILYDYSCMIQEMSTGYLDCRVCRRPFFLKLSVDPA